MILDLGFSEFIQINHKQNKPIKLSKSQIDSTNPKSPIQNPKSL